MTFKVSACVMADPRRAHLVPDLVRSINFDGLRVEWDRRRDRWDTGRRAILAYDPTATHHVVVQDDAIVCRDLVPGITEMLNYVPAGRPMGLYFGSRQPRSPRYENMYRRACKADYRWAAVTGSPLWGVGIVIPTDVITDLVEYCDHLRIESYDGRVRRWFSRQHIEAWYPIPSLVDHRSGPDHPSLIPDRRSPPLRVAHAFIGEDVSPLDVDWNTAPVR